jgi:hypothetical protein
MPDRGPGRSVASLIDLPRQQLHNLKTMLRRVRSWLIKQSSARSKEAKHTHIE